MGYDLAIPTERVGNYDTQVDYSVCSLKSVLHLTESCNTCFSWKIGMHVEKSEMNHFLKLYFLFTLLFYIQLVEHFFQSMANTSGMTLHIRQVCIDP